MNRSRDRLRSAVETLRHQSSSFSNEPWIGCELEGFFVDKADGHLLHISPEILQNLPPGIASYELGRSQFELNLAPGIAGRHTLNQWEAELSHKLNVLETASAQHNARVQLSGIPERLSARDMTQEKLFPVARMLTLDRAWKQAWDNFRCSSKNCFYGIFEPQSVAVSSCMSSTQLHLQLPADPERAARLWNSVASASPFALALYNEPIPFLGMSAFQEYRIPIWETLDDAGRGRVFWGPQPAQSLFEVLEHYVEAVDFLELGENLESLDERELLRKHIKNMWPWLRLIPEANHWRVEVRLFPSMAIPSVIELTHFWLGLIFGAQELSISELENRANLDAIARQGRNAEVVWFDHKRHSFRSLKGCMREMVLRGLTSLSLNSTQWFSRIEERLSVL